jgi:hypothetical protein
MSIATFILLTKLTTPQGTLSTIFSDSTPIGTTIIGGGIGGDASSAVGGVVTTISSGGSEIVSTITSGLAEASSRASDIGASVSSEASDIANSASSQISDIMNSGSGLISSILSTPTPTPTGDGEGNGEGNGDGSGEGNNPETTESDGAVSYTYPNITVLYELTLAYRLFPRRLLPLWASSLLPAWLLSFCKDVTRSHLTHWPRLQICRG